MVKRGDFLLQIDPEQYEAAVQRAEAGLSSAKAQAAQARRTSSRPSAAYDRNVEITQDERDARFRRRIEQSKTQMEVNEALLEAST